jgi:D-serine deaminase-like pyridoxal phosphate-dependent protein
MAMASEKRMRVAEVSTPAVIVDLDVLERNLDRMSSYCAAHGLGLRPHTKTHKTLEVARMQLERGACGLTVAKVGEAEVMAETGAGQILVAHPIIGEEKIRRLAALTGKADLVVALDSLSAAKGLSRVAQESGCTLGVLVEFDSGSHRCGVAAGETCAELGRAIQALEGVEVRGLMTYFGSVWGDQQQRRDEITRLSADVERTTDAFRRSGLPLEIVSAGSTPAAEMSHMVSGITEIRPGTYVFNDLNTWYQGLCTLEDCAVRVMTTVVSTCVAGQVIVDAGSKVFSSDMLSAGPKRGYGRIMEVEGASLSKLNEEHGFVEAGDYGAFSVGQVLSVIPNHVCTCINMHDEIYTARGGEIVGAWKIAARGKVR